MRYMNTNMTQDARYTSTVMIQQSVTAKHWAKQQWRMNEMRRKMRHIPRTRVEYQKGGHTIVVMRVVEPQRIPIRERQMIHAEKHPNDNTAKRWGE